MTTETTLGTGVHIIVQGSLPPKGRKKGQVEMYDARRYFCMTGDHLTNTPSAIELQQSELEGLHTQVFG
jgi:primase-polymerase (primpol)-like protein